MVTIVHLTRKRREAHGQEGYHLDALIAHPFKETVTHIPTSHIVVYQFHLYPLTCLVDQRIGEQHTQGVVGKDIHVDMDMTLGLGNLCQQGREESIAIFINFYMIILEGQ